MTKKGIIGTIGIDEAGRGALAGPVFVSSVFLPKRLERKVCKFPVPLRDSKELSPKDREKWYLFIKQLNRENKDFYFSCASISVEIIDKINISEAANLGASKTCKNLILHNKENRKIILDGGLKLRGKFFDDKKWVSIPKADENIPAVSLASIVAKVRRDRFMIKKAKKFSKYGIEAHKGYGTEAHIKAIKKFGYSKFHRKSFKI